MSSACSRRPARSWTAATCSRGARATATRSSAAIPPASARASCCVTEEVIAVASERAAARHRLRRAALRRSSRSRPATSLVDQARRRDLGRSRSPSRCPNAQCTFERIYFSRGNDPDIYRERKALGRNLAPRVVDRLGGARSRGVRVHPQHRGGRLPRPHRGARPTIATDSRPSASRNSPRSGAARRGVDPRRRSTAASAPRRSPTRTSGCARSSRTTRPAATSSGTSTTSPTACVEPEDALVVARRLDRARHDAARIDRHDARAGSTRAGS